MFRFSLISILCLSISGCGAIRSTKLYVPTWFGFVEITKGIYVDEKMSSTQRDDVLKIVRESKARVASFFGEIEGRPIILACSTEKCFTSNGGVSARAKAYGSSMILLSPRGLGVVFVSHELTHIELHTRIGAFRSWRSIPEWFDEGLAVLVSEDPRYTDNKWVKATENGRLAPELKSIGKTVPLGGDWQMGYGTSRHAVGKWYANAGRSGLLQLIVKVKSGNDFDTVLMSISPLLSCSSFCSLRNVGFGYHDSHI